MKNGKTNKKTSKATTKKAVKKNKEGVPIGMCSECTHPVFKRPTKKFPNCPSCKQAFRVI